MSEKKKKWIVGILFVLILILFGFIIYYVGRPLIRFAKEPEAFRLWVDAHGFLGKLAYIGMVVLQVVVAFIPGEPFEIAAGYAFGAVLGTILCMIGAFIGSMIVFFLVRKFGTKAVELFFKKESLDKLSFLKTGNKRLYIYSLIYILPGTPKDLLSYFAGLLNIPFPLWCFLSSVGRLPSIVTSTMMGAALGTKKYLAAGITLIITIIISLAGLKIYEYICEKKAGGSK